MSNQFITLGVQIDRYTANTVDTELNKQVLTFQDENDFGIDSTLLFGSEEELNFEFSVESINPTVQFGISQLNFAYSLNSIEPTLAFGTITLNRFILTESIINTVQFGTGFGFVSLGAAPIEPGVSFGTSSFQRPFHRSLIFKNDNITKLSGTGAVDDVEIASGIIIKASDTVSNTASSGTAELPSNPVGFIVVTINGTDYKMPYFNL